MVATIMIAWSLLLFGHMTGSVEAETHFSFTIREELPEGTPIGNVRDANESARSYTLSKDPKNMSLYFQLDSVTGQLSTSGKTFDRETECAFKTICEMNITIYATMVTDLRSITVTVTVTDINDKEPAFRNALTTLDILESEIVGKTYQIGTVYDDDSQGINTIQNITIQQNPENKFEIIKTKLYDGYRLSLELVAPLDRETVDTYDVTIIAKDGGDPVLSGTHSLRINVVDVNDNTPIFERDEYNVTIPENYLPGTVILTVKANDLDIGENAAITYSFSNREQTDTIRRLFSINSFSGEITVIANLTQESNEHYEFSVDATDNGGNGNYNTTRVKVTVLDVENNSPTVQITLLSSSKGDNVAYIEENQPEHYVVAHISVADNDKGDNGLVSCESSNPFFKLEPFQGQGYKISVAGVLDRENMTSYDVKVICKDHGNPAQSASAGFTVEVLDINDNDPVFEKSLYRAEIKENNSIQALITTVSATDADFGANGTVEYMLEEPDDRLTIDNETGEIFAAKSLDREAYSDITVTVLAVDHGPVRRTSSATVVIEVLDINDNPPFIVPARPEFWISENLPSGVIVGVLVANDYDSSNGSFTFEIAPLQTKFPFTFSPSGEIRTTESLDRELHNSYHIPVTVRDSDLNNTQYVTIYVTDLNDNAPIVTFPNEDNDTVTFEYRPDIYNVVTTVAAYDTDYGINGSLNFSIIDGNKDGIFEIDSSLGEVSVIKFMNIDSDRMFTLGIEVKDKGPVPMSTLCFLKIKLLLSAGSNAQPIVDDTGRQYIIISAIVIATTIVVAIAIIGVILFLRRLDGQKQPEEASTRYSDSGVSTGSGSRQTDKDSTDSGKSKNEVKISGMSGESSTDSYSSYYDLPPSYVSISQQPRSASHQERIGSLKLQQYLLQSKNWENNQVKQPHLGDSESETSRETNTCDSGRGGSVEDVSTSSPINEDKCFFPNILAENKVTKKVTFQHPTHYDSRHTGPGLSPVMESTPISYRTPARPPTLQPELERYGYSSSHSLPKLAIKTFPNTAQYHTNPNRSSSHTVTPNSHQRNSFHQPEHWKDAYNYRKGGHPPRMRHDSGSSVRSSDDEGGSTTSGSYTLEQADIEKDFYGRKNDILV